MGIPVLARETAGTPLRNPELILKNTIRSAAAFRAQKFPSANSLSIAVSNSVSARNLLKRAFSYSNYLRHFAYVAFIHPYSCCEG